MKRNPFFYTFLLLILFSMAAPASVYAADPRCYVKHDATGANTGNSWVDAYTGLQSALADANCTEIWVSAGVYKPGAARTDTFTLKSGVAIYGGFEGVESNLSERNPQTNITVLSGDIDNNDTTDANGVVTDAGNLDGDNSYRVVSANNVNNTAVLDGFVVTAGMANGGGGDNTGGGMKNISSSPTLANLTFSGNMAGLFGGGMYNSESSPSLSNVTFSGNLSNNSGGGIHNTNNSAPALSQVTFSKNHAANIGGGMINWSNTTVLVLSDVTFSNNTATNNGGGMYTYMSNMTLQDVVFTENQADVGAGITANDSTLALNHATFSNNIAAQSAGGINNMNSSLTLTNVAFTSNQATVWHGGGMYNGNSSNLTLTDVTFQENSAGYAGGGMANSNSTPTMMRVAFVANQSGLFGGGIHNDMNSHATLTNVLMSGNTSGLYGGGIANNNGSNPVLTNITLGGNKSPNGGAISSDQASNPTLTNVILWGNGSSGFVNFGGSTPVISYSNIQGCGGSSSWDSNCGTDSGGNIDADPLFVTPEPSDNAPATVGDYRLQTNSPAIDAGDNATPNLSGVTTDLDGNSRFAYVPTVPDTGNGIAPIVDMGAYEVIVPDAIAPTVIAIARQSPAAQLVTSGNSVTFRVTFSEPVSGVEVADFSVTLLSVPGNNASIASISQLNPSTYDVSVDISTLRNSKDKLDGAIRIDIPNTASITDLAGNPLDNLPYTNGPIYSIIQEQTFPDVANTFWAWTFIERLLYNGITSGYPDETYRPNNTVTRAEIAVFLLKAMNGPAYSAPIASPTFSDTNDHWAQNWIEALKTAGITGGYPDGTYKPDNTVTRAEMAVFLLKAKHGSAYTPPPASPTFSDTSGHWAQNWIEALKAEGITGGYPDGTYRPDNTVSRAEMAVFVISTFGLP